MPWGSKVHDPLRRHRKAIARAKGRQEYRRDAIGRMYLMPEWRDPVTGLRAMHVAREPLCRECRAQGVDRPGVEVDHIKPHRGDMTLFLDPDNLQTLCKMHHSMKTAKEKNGA